LSIKSQRGFVPAADLDGKKNSCHGKIITNPTTVAARGRVGTDWFPPRAHDVKSWFVV